MAAATDYVAQLSQLILVLGKLGTKRIYLLSVLLSTETEISSDKDLLFTQWFEDFPSAFTQNRPHSMWDKEFPIFSATRYLLS